MAYRGLPGQLNLDATWGERSTFRSEMWGDWPIMEVLPEPLVASEPLLRALDGTAAMQAVLTVEDRVGEVPGDIWLEVSSNLQGVSIDLPEPLSKAGPKIRFAPWISRTGSRCCLMSRMVSTGFGGPISS